MGAGVSWIPPATPAPVVKEEFTLIYKPPASPKPQPPPPPKPKKIVRPPTKVVKKVVKKSVAHKLPSMRKKVSPPKAQQHAKAFKSKSLKPPPPKPQKVTAPTPPGILGLLQKSQHLAAPGESAAVAAVSHLTHVDSSSHMGYRVSGLAAKLPPGEQVRTGGGSGEMVTSGRSVITGGAGHLVKARGNRVEGLVQELPEDVSTGGSGLLDRHEIDKVVAQHQHEISRCYERELLHNASIQGKLQVEWIINPNGRVISVKQQTSSIKNNKLIKCIMNRIKTWHFPPPRGGSVVVNYPFLLKSIDF
jgi:outer membrane biosynthesis protein TonB